MNDPRLSSQNFVVTSNAYSAKALYALDDLLSLLKW
jgi:hypothetical protein